MGVGGAFDVLQASGTGSRGYSSRARASTGLFRLAQDPRRRAKRYAIGNANSSGSCCSRLRVPGSRGLTANAQARAGGRTDRTRCGHRLTRDDIRLRPLRSRCGFPAAGDVAGVGAGSDWRPIEPPDAGLR